MRHHPSVTEITRGSISDEPASGSPATLSAAYPTQSAARHAIETLEGLDVPRGEIRLLIGRTLHDTRHEPVGGWGGPVGPYARVGTFGGGVRLRRQGTGSYAGDPDEQRQGSWADVDRVVIVSFKDNTEHSRITGLRGARRLLRTAALDDDTIEREVDELRLGHAVLLVTPTAPLSDLSARFEYVARAA